ncbi:RagB/SusD family nutrient uptake outer membrane protein [Polaribacter aestuariivivens]|uniref:RagB/SusD family nutrient uptake outer membrane protein n=1 Tax=Polaribacter aestuariivivens TaxID=2304626 RepID=A0A5S3N3W8_9FLAO|nr:RagB/SusD family nutrient uptake outer membrane protein [Polaribacter aestuariivivens]TMM29492.1 RagB/SusD family nutrient uptake outer membrane protein [Polaribacter aestuariivivens]
MNKLFKYGLLTAFIGLGFSCGDSFLEDPAQNSSTTLTSVQLSDAIAVDPTLSSALMSGVYALTFDTGSGGTGGHDDFGMKSYDIFGDMLSGDMALSQSVYGWYRASITEFGATQDFTFGDNRQVWRYYYRIINACNQVIDGLGGTDVTPDNQENKYTMGQAKALRAHSYFYLAQFYQKEYVGSEEILPIYTNSVDENGPKVTAEVIYDLMESDLTEAISLLNGFTRANKTEINQSVAQGIYAYVLGARGTDYQKAYNMATAALAGYPIMSSSEVTGGFNNVATPGWMWGVDLNDEIGLGLVSWWGQMDYYSYSYPAFGDHKAIDSGLYAAIPANDVRKNQFFNDPSRTEHLMPLFKFYDSDRTRYGSSRIVKADYVYMRVAEMYLLAAEYASRINEGNARTMLKAVVSKRVPDASYIDGLSGQALKDEIYLQTRIELWGEGRSYLAMKRNKATVTRGDNHLSFVGVPIPYNDERMAFEIPEGEIQFNPFISTQND